MNAITLILELPGGALTEPVGGCLVSSASVVQGEGTKDENRCPDTKGVAIGNQHCPSVPLLNLTSLQ